MEWTRVKDWLIGAAGMLLVLGILVGALWWAGSKPASRGEAVPPPNTREAEAEAPSDLRGDELWFGDLVLDSGTVRSAGSTLRDVHAVGEDVVTGPEGTVVGRLAVDATVPFDVVARELGGGTVVSAADSGQARVVRTIEALGRELRVTATGTVHAEGGKLVVEPRSIDLGGPAFFSGGTAAVVRSLVTIEHEIEGLPAGLVLQDVAVRDDGIRASLRGEDVRLGP
ncbi:DUF2993 domain-containing protein [Pseudarthrobacter sp. NamE2]|uniref:LmeA family phospholipid-binding protein n=1 Tax=Pseudarthrobacter sp. NamE2 TaxID=2576838 RepID=UPI0010FEB40D|nr:LmeA family phospholipid-binding protein [Pseudarthrobacter sp. NamE2]TLM86490.1 DUF2993 domain-containing protein [Pseudarthrobacter sp. NamE2]